MSTTPSTSDRAEGRLADLRGSALARLRAHAPLTDRLELVDDVDVGADAIRPAYAVDIQHRADGAEPPSAVLAVGAVTSSSRRENRQERKRHVVQTDLQVRDGAMKRLGPAWMDAVLDEVAAVLTAHADGWAAWGVRGGSVEPLWDEDITRFHSMNRFAVEHWG